LGEIDNTPAATAKLVKKFSGKYDRLTFCYEAGPTGYGLYRQIKPPNRFIDSLSKLGLYVRP
jgi:hypothetical protein